jgi:hypothetical protein
MTGDDDIVTVDLSQREVQLLLRYGYRYYVSPVSDEPQIKANGWRLPAAEIEQRVQEIVTMMLQDRVAIAASANASGVKDSELSQVLDQVGQLSNYLGLVKAVHLSASTLKVILSVPHQPPITIERWVPLMLRRRGIEQKLVMAGSAAGKTTRVDAALINTISRGFQYWTMLASGEVASTEELAKKVRLSGQTMGRIVPLGMLAPDIVEAIIEGKQPATLTARELLHDVELPVSWEEQRQVLGFG